MSLDLYLVWPTECPHCKELITLGATECWGANYTHNVTPMWRKAGVYEALYESEGHYAREYIEVLAKGVVHMESNIDEYRQLNPENRWGNADSALKWLKRTYRAFEENPDLMVHVSS